MSPPLPWATLKFGGTSVATADHWERISARIRELRGSHRVWIVASALSQVSNRLEAAIDEALRSRPDQANQALSALRTQHEDLAAELGLSPEAMQPVRDLLDELERLMNGIRLTREASPRLRARVLSFGELASTSMGQAALAKMGIPAHRVDARKLLRSDGRATAEDRFLNATVHPTTAVGLADDAAEGAGVVITQGFIAGDTQGETVLLGRGGSDISAALFAALTGSEFLEIWTDVHGLFTADPRQVPSARLIRRATYREAQELAAMGAKVLHPRSLAPAAWAKVPIRIKNLSDPDAEGTQIGPGTSAHPAVLAVVRRQDVSLLTLSTLEMWGAPGFLARTFAPFAELGISVDLVATSQSAVSVTLDHVPGGVRGAAFSELLRRLQAMGQVDVRHRCGVVSIVGRKIRAALHRLGPALAVFREQEVYLVSESSEDLNLSFVVDEERADRLVSDLHAQLVPLQGDEELLGDSWELLRLGSSTADTAAPTASDDAAPPWWQTKREKLLGLCPRGQARYVYHLATVRDRAESLQREVPVIDRFYYAMKANDHEEILQTVVSAGLGLECVSAAEVLRGRALVGDEVPILFTPNFCPDSEYETAFSCGAEVTLDSEEDLAQLGSLLNGRAIAVRVDPGSGRGHHDKVRTAGAHAKFGLILDRVEAFVAAAGSLGARVVGLHAHVGSGILNPEAWESTAALFGSLRPSLPELRWVDLGGGLGVPERPGQQPLDLSALNRSLEGLRPSLDGLELRMEPGRFLVSEAGVLLASVTQVRSKGSVRFVGLATGMNSLLRPALYGAWHGIHNLSRPEPPSGYAHVVGPICETGDILGRDRLLPETQIGDVLVITHAGAYGRVMGSHYNRREPAEEVVLTS